MVKKKIESDHNLIETRLNIPWNKKADELIEVFNFKDKQGQDLFFKNTNKTEDLIKIFDSNKSLEIQTKKFLKRLDGFIHQSFKKIRITSKVDRKLEELYEKRRYFRNKDDEKVKKSLIRLKMSWQKSIVKACTIR